MRNFKNLKSKIVLHSLVTGASKAGIVAKDVVQFM